MAASAPAPAMMGFSSIARDTVTIDFEMEGDEDFATLQDAEGQRQFARVSEGGALTPRCSTALFLEYEAFLSREETRKATGRSLEDVAAVMSALAAVSEGVDISFRTRPILSDAADEMVLEATLNGEVEAIVTHNVKDSRPALKLSVTIATPGEIVRRLNT